MIQLKQFQYRFSLFYSISYLFSQSLVPSWCAFPCVLSPSSLSVPATRVPLFVSSIHSFPHTSWQISDLFISEHNSLDMLHSTRRLLAFCSKSAENRRINAIQVNKEHRWTAQRNSEKKPLHSGMEVVRIRFRTRRVLISSWNVDGIANKEKCNRSKECSYNYVCMCVYVRILRVFLIYRNGTRP